jgi:hypothetical protein
LLALAVAAFAATTDAATGVTSYTLPVLPAGGASVPIDNRFAGRSLLHDNCAIAAAFNAKGREASVDIGQCPGLAARHLCRAAGEFFEHRWRDVGWHD